MSNRDFKRKLHDTRPFLAIDGEGVTINKKHIYVQFSGKSATDMIGHSISDPKGLSGFAIFRHIIRLAETYSNHIFVIYGGSYDFNKWLEACHFTRGQLEKIYSGSIVDIGPWRIRWMKGKNFYIGIPHKKIGVTIYDVVSFFQTSFVKACDSYLGDRFIDRENIVVSKSARGSFRIDQLDSITDYNDSELTNLLYLMNELRDRLSAAELYPRRWDGPGAVAAYLLQKMKIKNFMDRGPANLVARYAYAGGRFEVIKFGHVETACYEYDINSAYPNAMQYLPSLKGKWYYKDNAVESLYALYRITWHVKNPSVPGPLFRRLKNGTVHYPLKGTGWYWTPEYEAAKIYIKKYGGTLTVDACWVFKPDSTYRPFGFVKDLYDKRQILKAAGNGAHVGYKLALNSLYGKTAQQVGARFEGGEWKLPPFHQLEWAGFITSHCRAKILFAAMQDLKSVIAFETDALFTTRPLKLDIGPGLGQWTETIFANLTYMQSGTYYADGKIERTNKTRGIDKGSMDRAECLAIMAEPSAEKRMVTVQMKRFYGLGVALMQGLDKWGQWITVTKNVQIEPTGKRIHAPHCTHPQCRITPGIAVPGWHTTICPTLDSDSSTAFPIIWEPGEEEAKAVHNQLREKLADYEDHMVE